MFLAFWAFALPRLWLEGVHFLIFGLFHSLGFGGRECISCFLAFSLPWFWLDGVLFLLF